MSKRIAAMLYRVVESGKSKDAFVAKPPYPAGRWTSEGTPVIYASRTAATAVLEKLAHLETAQEIALEIVIASMPAALLGNHGELPPDWYAYPYRKAVQRAGDGWLQSHRALAIPVPSALVRCEENVLIDGQHPELERIEIVDCLECVLDRRLLR